MNRVPVFLPKNLDLRQLLSENRPSFDFHIDDFRHVISIITEIPAYRKDLLDLFDYVPVNAQVLQGRVREYHKYLAYLVQNDVLETDGFYIPGEKATGYRFTPKYSQSVRVEFIEKASLVKQLTRKSKFDLYKEKRHKNLNRWFNDDLEIDFDAGLHYLTDQLNLNRANGVKNSMLKFNSNFVGLYRLYKKDYFFKIDSNVGRLHTNMTVMKSELRNFISFAGVKMVSVDISNSQPCLSGVLLNENFFSGGENAEKMQNPPNPPISLNFNKINNKFKKVQSSILATTIMLVKHGESIDSKDIQEYLKHIESGTLYEYMADEIDKRMGIKYNPESKDGRKKLKEIIFTVLFTDNRFIGQADAEPKRIFRTLFPSVYKVFALVKKKDPTSLPRLLQTIESHLILDKIAKRISREIPDIPIFTIHDSIACPVGFEKQVAGIMKEEINKAIGITPNLKFEYWLPENLAPKTALVA